MRIVRPTLSTLALVLFAVVHCAPRARAQEVVDWSSFEFCYSCELTSTEFLSLGDQDGDGAIEGEYMRVVAGSGRGYLVYRLGGGTRFLHFDERGRFQRSIGVEGDGPGEFRLIADLAFTGDDRIIALDYHRRAWITYEESGAFVGEVRSALTPGVFRLATGDSIAVVGLFDRQPETVGFPLHRVRVADGVALSHFGQIDASWDIQEPYATSVLVGEEERVEGSVWWGKVGRPHVEEWTVDGEHIRTFTGDLDWFRSGASRNRDSPPRVAVAGFAVDTDDRLWLLTYVPDERWREVPRYGAERGVIQDDYYRWQDTRLDVFDLSTRRHLGFRKWDTIDTKLMQRGGVVYPFTLEYQTPLWPRIVLHEVDLAPQPREEVEVDEEVANRDGGVSRDGGGRR
jgi:hypothetical protein